jgi:large conductance mechanosensitive channel
LLGFVCRFFWTIWLIKARLKWQNAVLEAAMHWAIIGEWNMSFKDFVLKGNVMDLAVGVIIGGAFGKIVDSLVKDLIMPVIGMFGQVDFKNLFVKLNVPEGVDAASITTYDAATKAGVNILGYGNFVTIVINFLILAFVIYQLVKYSQNAMAKFAPPPAPPTADQTLLTEIRDLLKK